MTQLTEIYNYLPITAELVTAGQPTEAQLAAIQAAGFQVVVNLALPTSDNALPDERAVVEAAGMTYVPIPVVWEQPTLADFQRFQQVMADHAGQQILVHCAANMRVSVFVYLHRCLSGVPEAEAAQALAQIWTPNPTWRQFMSAVLEHGIH